MRDLLSGSKLKSQEVPSTSQVCETCEVCYLIIEIEKSVSIRMIRVLNLLLILTLADSVIQLDHGSLVVLNHLQLVDNQAGVLLFLDLFVDEPV